MFVDELLICSCGGEIDYRVTPDGNIKRAVCKKCGKKIPFRFKADNYEQAIDIIQTVFDWDSKTPISKSIMDELKHQV